MESISLNCTFMELKSYQAWQASSLSLGLNCTFMELKYVQTLRIEHCNEVLIVPLWN